MATVAQTLSFYNESNIFGSVPPMSTCNGPTLMMNENGTVSFGTALATGSGQSLLNSFTDVSNFGSTWPELYAPTSLFNSTALQPLSEPPFTDDQASDFFLMGNTDSEFLQHINGVAAVMHPNLVSTLKNMVAPGPGSPRHHQFGSSQQQFSCLSFFDQQPSTEGDRLGSSIFTRCHEASEKKAALNVVVDESKLVVDTRAISPICSPQPGSLPVKVEKSETDESIEAAVVSVDLIQNRRPFRCQQEGCNKTFKNPQTMKMHHKTHYTDGSAASKAGLLSLPTLSNSLKAGHNKKIPSRCPKCKKTFVGLYELRRHYGRKHSEGEKPFGCRKCGKKFYIEVDVRDHEKLCGEPIECKCGLKFAFKCNLVAHKKAHPACQDQQTTTTSTSPSSSMSASESCTHHSTSSSSDSDQSTRGGSSSPGSSSPPSTSAASRGTRRQREETLSPIHTTSKAPLPDFKDIPEAPQFKCARYDLSGLQQPRHTSSEAPYYPTVPTFSHLPANPLYPSPQQSQHFAFKIQQHQQQFGGFSFPGEMMFNTGTSSTCSPLQSMVRLH